MAARSVPTGSRCRRHPDGTVSNDIESDFTPVASAEFRVKYAVGVVAPDSPTAASASVIPGWLSVPVVDQSREFVDGRDIDTADFRLNPVLLWCHDQKRPPLGSVASLDVLDYGPSGFKGLYGLFEFDPADEFAQLVYRKFAAGYMRGFSIGYKTLGRRAMSAAEQGAAGYSGRDTPTRLRVKLFEASAVPIPDNQRAVADLRKSLRLTDQETSLLDTFAPAPATFAADLTPLLAKNLSGRFPGGGEHEGTTKGTTTRPPEAPAMSQTTDTVQGAAGTDTVAGAAKADVVQVAGKAMGTESDAAGGSLATSSKPHALGCKAVIAGACKAFADAAAHWGGSDHPKKDKTAKGVGKWLGKACRLAHKAMEDDGDEEAGPHGDLIATTFGGDDGGGDADGDESKNDDSSGKALVAFLGEFNDAVAAEFKSLRGENATTDARLTAIESAVGTIAGWQARAEEFFGGLAESQRTISQSVNLLAAAKR